MTRFPAIGGGDSTTPIMLEDKAQTFVESDVTTGGLGIQNESLSLNAIRSDETVARTSDDASYNSFDYAGVKINPNNPLSGVELEISGNQDTVTEVQVFEGGSIVATNSVSANSGDFVTIMYDMAAGSNYWIECTTSGDHGACDSASFPYTGTDLDIVNGAYSYGNDSSRPYSFRTVRGFVDKSSASSTVSWPNPDDVYRWDAATFTATEDGETVDVYIEESTDGGSTWTEIAGPISRGQDITAAPDSQMRFRVDISRSDTANNPTLDSIYRRWVV